MKNKIRSLLVALGLAAAAIAPTATAGLLIVTINGAICVDNTACDTNLAPNIIQTNGGGFALLAAQSFSNNPGDASGGTLDLSWQIITGPNTGGAIQIIAFQDGFTLPPPGPATLLSVISGDIRNGTLNAQQFLDDFTPGIQGPFTAGGTTVGFTDTKTLGLILAGPYSLEEVLNFNFVAGTVSGTSTGDFSSTVLPEPGTLALLGLALFGFAVSRRRKS